LSFPDEVSKGKYRLRFTFVYEANPLNHKSIEKFSNEFLIKWVLKLH
jgi:hypothetical protein